MSAIVQYWHSEEPPEEIAELMASFDEHNPELRHLVFSEASAARFVAEHFGPREVAAFEACATPTIQADYFRCCATLVLGGVYADADLRCLAPLARLLEELDEGELFGAPAVPAGLRKLGLSSKEIFGDVERVGDYLLIANGFFAFRTPAHPLLELTLEVTTAHIESRASENLVALTGGVFTSLYLLRELGSFDAFIEYASHGALKPVAPVTCEAIGDFQRVPEAFAHVRISPGSRVSQWVRHAMPSYKQTDKYWTRGSPRLLRKLPPGPDLSAERQTARIAMRPLAFLEECRARYGEVFTIRALDESPWVMVSDPELIKEVFKAPGDVLHAGEAKQGVLGPLLGDNSILLLDEERHTEQRRLLLPPFGAGQVERYAEAMRAAAMPAIEEWPLDREQPAARWTRPIALEVILHAVFGVGGGKRLRALRRALRELRFPDNARQGWTAAYRRSVEPIDELIFAEIAERAGDGGAERRDDVLSLLLGARHEDGSPMSSVEIRDELMTLLMAGYETTATTLAWALEHLARNPAALAALEREAGSGGPYTDAAIKETLRLRPAVPTVARAVKRPFRLGEHVIPPGAMLRLAVLLVHHRPDIYPEPRAFRPERFLESPPDAGAWLPFGGGNRRCIGARFALLEMRVVLSALLARATVRTAEAEPEAMRNRDLTLTPARGARVTLTTR